MISAAAYIELNIPALQHNVRKVRGYAPESKLMAVIKANAYGHGLIKIANYLAEDVDAFAVARLDEAIRLRESQIKGRIIVLQGFSQHEELEALQRYQLEAVIYSEAQIEVLESANLQEALTVWLKIDTGMNRLGVSPAQFVSVLPRLQQCKGVRAPIGFMTHFANADDVQDDKTLRQLQLFNDTIKNYIGEKLSISKGNIR